MHILENSEGIRLQKFLASRGYGSRRAIEDHIRQGQITVNGKKAELGNRVQGDEDIRINGQKIKNTESKKIWIVFHKPFGVESTCAIPRTKGEKTLQSFNFGPIRVFPVGRLDKDSRGLLLLTNDGERANELMHPRYEHEKEYEVVVDKPVTQKHIQELESGVFVNGKKTTPCTVKKLGKNKFNILLREGRNRQIRKMCEAVDLTVTDLFRIRIQDIKINGIKPGEWKTISVGKEK